MRRASVLFSLAIVFASNIPGALESSAATNKIFENTLGMKFVPVAGQSVMFCTLETRITDYQVFLGETDRPWTPPDFQQTNDHPVVNVTWDDATAFCDWLTKKERQEGKIGGKQRYRLPKDVEWTIAAGFPSGQGNTPEVRLKNSVIWPWGHYWPPLAGDGNFAAELQVDSFDWTAPAGQFRANRFGLYDLGGNVWEWCDDWYNEANVTKTLRGGSFNDSLPQYLLVSYRFNGTMNLSSDDIGFRVVFDPGE